MYAHLLHFNSILAFKLKFLFYLAKKEKVNRKETDEKKIGKQSFCDERRARRTNEN